MLVCWWWWFDWSFCTTYSSITCIILLLQWTPANPGSPGIWPLKRRLLTLTLAYLPLPKFGNYKKIISIENYSVNCQIPLTYFYSVFTSFTVIICILYQYHLWHLQYTVQLLNMHVQFTGIYEGRSINKLQNSAITLILKIGKIRNIRFVRNLILKIHRNFFDDDIILWRHLFTEHSLSVYYFLHQFSIITQVINSIGTRKKRRSLTS